MIVGLVHLGLAGLNWDEKSAEFLSHALEPIVAFCFLTAQCRLEFEIS